MDGSYARARSANFTRTTTQLRYMGAKGMTEYIQAAFPRPNSTSYTPPATFAPSTPTPAAGKTTEVVLHDVNKANQAPIEEDTEVPFYIKVRGKGKGKPVMFDRFKSSVAQIYEYAAQTSTPDPIFKHTSEGAAHLLMFRVFVSFDGLTATHADFAGSIKEGKELACSVLADRILARNAGIVEARA